MEIILRNLRKGQDPGEGEVLVLSDSGKGAATAAFERGIDSFPHKGKIERCIVPVSPTLDDMLAAAILIWREESGELPGRLQDYARYAGIAREGLRPSSGVLQDSLEGTFLAIRNARDPDLGNPELAAKFLDDWQRLEKHIRAAVDADRDPFSENVLAESTHFARERAFLAKDHQVYLQDVQRGERWNVAIPGGPPKSSALILRQPKSLLWKYWAREDSDAPSGNCYLVLGVQFGAGNWTFSVDPVQRLSLKQLAEAFQLREIDRGGVVDDPWFDGERFDYTLVAAPRAGTNLTDDEVLSIFRKWTNARKPVSNESSGGLLRILAVVTAAALLVAVGIIVAVSMSGSNPETSPNRAIVSKDESPDFRARGIRLQSEKLNELRSEGVSIEGYALIVAVGDSSYQPKLPAASTDAGLLYGLLRDKFGYKPENMLVLVDEPERALDKQGDRVPLFAHPTRENVSKALLHLSKETRRFPEGDRTNFVFYYAGHGHTFQRADEIGYLVLSDFWETPEEDRLPDTQAYNMGHLARDVRQNIKSSHQIMLIDCCFSGFVTKARGNPKAEPSAVYELWKQKAHVVITAGTEQQRAFEVGSSSVFSQTLLRGLGMSTDRMLADANSDGILTDAELGDWMSNEVPKVFGRSSKTQTPQYIRGLEELDDVGQFLFLPRE